MSDMALCRKRDYLEELRLKKDWTYDQLAERMGCSATTCWNIENGAKEVLTVPDIEDIAYAFQIPSVKVYEMEVAHLNKRIMHAPKIKSHIPIKI